MDVIEQKLRAAEAAAQVEELKLQLAKRKLLASSHGSNASGKHADKYLRAHQSPGIDNTMRCRPVLVNRGEPEQAREGPAL